MSKVFIRDLNTKEKRLLDKLVKDPNYTILKGFQRAKMGLTSKGLLQYGGHGKYTVTKLGKQCSQETSTR